MMKGLIQLSIITVLFISIGSCRYITNTEDGQAKGKVINTTVEHPDWTDNAVIYEVNIRQYTPEGNFKAFTEHISRLKDLGVDILWLMPVHPIGEKNRKGKLGSYYSIKDYYAVNPEFGTKEDLIDLIREVHAMDMYVIIDWVANHTAWDNLLIKEHPDWYKKDSLGKIISPFDWTDVAQLNYEKQELRNYMTDVMKYWVEEYNVDGFRCDVAGMVPCSFWDSTRKVLDEIKPVFMLAEDEQENCLVEKAFDMNYSWELHHILNYIAKGTMDARDLRNYFKQQDNIYDPAIYRMNFTSNHDENSWNGSEFERFGEAAEAFTLLTFTVPGMPLIYSGQETGMQKRLRFFDKDTIAWNENKWKDIFTRFIELKKGNSVFENGATGGNMKVLSGKGSKKVFAFERVNDDQHAVVIVNLTDKKTEYKIKEDKIFEGDYLDYFADEDAKIDKTIELAPYGYKVYITGL